MKKNTNWLEDAKDLDVYVGTTNQKFNDLTDELFRDLSKQHKIKKKGRTREALKLILLNLWKAQQEDKPLKYSRSPNSYSHSRRYGKLHIKYDKIIPIVDTLEKWGLVHQEKGFYDHEKKLGRLTRFYASNDLIGLFHSVRADFNMIDRLPPKEPIQLRNGDKEEIDYTETKKTIDMRKKLFRYNSFISKQKVKLNLNQNTSCTLNLLYDLKSKLLHGYSSIININGSIVDSTNTNRLYSTVQSMTNKIKDFIEENEEVRLSDFTTLDKYNIDNITILLKYEILKRVFNKESFKLGGRFYDAGHIFLNEEDRKLITINDNPTVELDYSAHHIRMLYHLKGINYTADPYGTLCDDEKERGAYKLVQLVSINCPPEKDIIWSIRKGLRRARFYNLLTDEKINRMIERFQEAHKPIADKLFSGEGLKLQNMDSMITEAILMRLMKENIPCLPIHDSYIVEAQYKDVLEEAMIQEYEKVMGFEPIIK